MMCSHSDLPDSLAEPSQAGTIVLAATDEHTQTGLTRTLAQLPWPIRRVSGAAAVVHEVNSNRRGACVVLSSFDEDPANQRRLAVRLAAFPRGSNYLIYILDDHEPRTIAAAFEAGADDVLTRPLLMTEVRARLDHAWQYMELERLRERVGAQGALMAEMATATVVHSRNYLDNELGKELERSRRYNHSVAVVLAEAVIPYGPAEGAMRAAGRYLLELVRKDIDWIARFDSRSFAIVLPETGVRNAGAATRRLCRKLQKVDLRSAGLPADSAWQFGVAAFDRITAPKPPGADALLSAARDYLNASRRYGPYAVSGGTAAIRAGAGF